MTRQVEEAPQGEVQEANPVMVPVRRRENWPLIILIFALFIFCFTNAIFRYYLLTGRTDQFHFIKWVYNFNTLYYPCLLLVAALVSLSLRPGKRTRRAGLFALAIAFLMFGMRLYATHIEPKLLQVHHVALHSAKTKAPLRILHIAGIQAANIGAYERRAFEKMRGLQPDLIIHTGDLLQPVRPATMESELPKVIENFRLLDPQWGIFNVIGDTDFHLNSKRLRDEARVITLTNQVHLINAFQTRISMLGLTLGASEGGEETRKMVEDWLAACKPEDFTILYGHRPDFIMTVQDLAIDLCLAGHTHGGQIRIPFYGPPMTLSHVPRDWARGYRETGRTRLNVSAGIGAEHMWEMPSIRINCPPEMTLIEIKPD